ncbi:MAG: hypothetical protein JXA82_12185 [Sedimentisphaerales bacterium]|nr:hypothetical protein [Sedimentisphaerales bacterium]
MLKKRKSSYKLTWKICIFYLLCCLYCNEVIAEKEKDLRDLSIIPPMKVSDNGDLAFRAGSWPKKTYAPNPINTVLYVIPRSHDKNGMVLEVPYSKHTAIFAWRPNMEKQELTVITDDNLSNAPPEFKHFEINESITKLASHKCPIWLQFFEGEWSPEGTLFVARALDLHTLNQNVYSTYLVVSWDYGLSYTFSGYDISSNTFAWTGDNALWIEQRKNQLTKVSVAEKGRISWLDRLKLGKNASLVGVYGEKPVYFQGNKLYSDQEELYVAKERIKWIKNKCGIFSFMDGDNLIVTDFKDIRLNISMATKDTRLEDFCPNKKYLFILHNYKLIERISYGLCKRREIIFNVDKDIPK